MSEALTQALIEALEDEYKARATYRLILAEFGPVRPFVNIVESEERHIQALLPLFQRYGIPIPPDDWAQRVTVPASVREACQEGVQAEIENAAMYQRLLAATQDYPDVQRVFLNLQRASQMRHLVAFRRCVERGGGQEAEGRGQRAGGREEEGRGQGGRRGAGGRGQRAGCGGRGGGH